MPDAAQHETEWSRTVADVQRLVQVILNPGELVIGVDKLPPVSLHAGLSGSPDFKGFEVDLTSMIDERRGLQLHYCHALWKGQQAGYDFVLAEVSRRKDNGALARRRAGLAVLAEVEFRLCQASKQFSRRTRTVGSQLGRGRLLEPAI
jgi:hypothetical protein